MRNSSGQRNTRLDFLRILFATLVLLSHAPEITDGNRSREILTHLTRGAETFGGLAVKGFFLLSGYLIVQSWERKPVLMDFLRKRTFRIVPGFVVATLLSTVVVGLLAPGVPNFFRNLNGDFPLSVLLLSPPVTPQVFPGQNYAMVNGSLWTIAYEFRCYLLVAVCGLLGSLRRSFVVFAGTIGLLLISASGRLAAMFSWHHGVKYFGDPKMAAPLFAVFGVGACFYLFRGRILFTRTGALIAGTVLLAFLAVPRFFPSALAVFGGYLLFYFARPAAPPLLWMKGMPDISYGIYLYGWPIQMLLIWYFRASPWLIFLISVPISFLFGWMSWTFVEKPMQQFARATARLGSPSAMPKAVAAPVE